MITEANAPTPDLNPYDEGMEAALDGKPMTANPYPLGSKEHNEFNAGYLDAEEEQ